MSKTGDMESRGNLDPPPPESPVWLPSLAAPRSAFGQTYGHSAAGFTLPKPRNLPTGLLSRKHETSGLFSMNTLPTLDAPGVRQRKQQAFSKVPKLPSIEAGRATASPSATSRSRGGLVSGAHKASPQSETKRHTRKPESHDRDQMSEEELSMDNGSGGSEHAPPGPIIDDSACDPDHVPGIETGDDVIDFYGKYGQDSFVKFFYCNRAKETLRFRPYDLVVVSRQKVDAEYFTVSATGVMRIKRGVQAEFTSLAEWVREKTLFDLISSIGFFKNYLTGRAFGRWRKGVRQKHFKSIREKIEDSLFLAKPTFAPHLLEIWATTNELRSISFANTNANHLYMLQEWADLQTNAREQKARPALESIVERVQRVLERVCREVQKQALLYQESVRDEAELEDTTGVELIQGRTAGRARSMTEVKREKQERAANFSRVMQELTMLGKFIRLADYLFVEGMIECVIESVDATVSLLVSPRSSSDKQSKGIFLSTISFLSEGMQFTPDSSAILEEINTALEGTISVAQQAPRIIFMRAFAPFFEGKPSGLNPPSIIRSTSKFQSLRELADNTLLEDFAEAHEYVQMFEEYRKIYEFGQTWSFEEYTAKPKTLREIRRDMHRQREWRNELDRMKTSHVVGCLYVDSKSLRNDLMPITSNTLEKIKGLMLNMSRETCLKVLEDAQARVNLLKSRPTVLDEFMGFQVRFYLPQAYPLSK